MSSEVRYQLVEQVVRRHLGLELGNNNGRRMVENRLRRIQDVDALLVGLLADPPDLRRLPELADALTTNVTSFGRHREVFAECAHQLGAMKGQQVRIWSAGCSTGEEAFDLAMMAWGDPERTEPRWDFQILATDISPSALEAVRAACYDKRRVLPNAVAHFEECPGGLRVRERLRERVTVRSFNLLTVPYPFRPQFDIIFVRNVLIYFGAEVRRDVIRRMVDVMKPNGLLAVGACETIPDLPLRSLGSGLHLRSSVRATWR